MTWFEYVDSSYTGVRHDLSDSMRQINACMIIRRYSTYGIRLEMTRFLTLESIFFYSVYLR